MIYPWQQSQWQHVDQLLNTDRLPHAMLLLGNQGLGKADFSLAMAHAVLCNEPAADHQACGHCKACHLLAANTHPDLHHIAPKPPPNSKSKNPVLSVRIADIRALCETLNQTSQFSGYRVAIIEQAELMTVSAANSLLKTLEEPGQNVLIVLSTSRSHRLPVTIRSRCQSLRFTIPDEKTALAWLQDKSQGLVNTNQVSIEQMKQALKYTDGSPLAALEQIAQAEHQQILSEAMTANISGKNTLDYAAKLAKFGKINTLEGMLSWVSDISRLSACGAEVPIINEQYRAKLQTLAETANKQRLYRFHDQLNFNLLHSSIAVNEQLLWENLLLSWDKI